MEYNINSRRPERDKASWELEEKDSPGLNTLLCSKVEHFKRFFLRPDVGTTEEGTISCKGGGRDGRDWCVGEADGDEFAMHF